MKRLLAGVGTALLVTIGAAGAVSATTPPDTTPPSAEAPATAHPIVGTWLFTFVGEDEVPFTGAFLSDGVFIEFSDGSTSIGVWEATGPDTAAMTYHATDEEGTVTVRASFTVDGDNLSADYTIQFAGEGAPEGEYGPGQVEALVSLSNRWASQSARSMSCSAASPRRAPRAPRWRQRAPRWRGGTTCHRGDGTTCHRDGTTDHLLVVRRSRAILHDGPVGQSADSAAPLVAQ